MRKLCIALLLSGWAWANPVDDLAAALQRNDLASVRAALQANPGLLKQRGGEMPPRSTTVLASAARWGRLEIVQLAVNGGADLEAGGEGGLTPLALAAQNGHKDVVAYLVSKKAHFDGALTAAAGAGKLSTVKQLVEAGCPVDSTNSTAETALHKAVQLDRVDLATYLLQKGANPKAADWQGRAPSPKSEAMRKLLQKGRST